jgi:hypothetical protein
MKRIIILLVVTVLASVCNAAFDFTLSGTEYNSMSLDNQSLLVTGGGAGTISAIGGSYIEVQDTLPYIRLASGISNLNIAGTSMLHYYGGETKALGIYNEATAVLEGGRIDYIGSFQYVSSPNIEMIVKDYSYNAGTNLLTGVWRDDTMFSIELTDQDGYDPVIDNIAFTVVPEPMTLLLFGLGAVMVKRRK